MKWCPWIVVLLLAASCAAPQPPEAWSVERVTPTDDRPAESGVCSDVRTFALGSHAAETSLGGTLDELARIAALTGATAALPLLSDLGELDTDDSLTDAGRRIRQHDLLVLASRSIDASTAASCSIPAFSALYAASGFPECHFEMEIPVAGYTAVGTPGTCSAEGRPTFLPCWTTDGDHLPIDCVSNEIVQAVGDRWDPAGEPRLIEIDRVDPDAAPGPEVLVPSVTSECSALTDLFTADPLPNGTIPDFDRLVAAAGALDPAVQAQIDEFILASVSPPSFDVFEALVSELDEATAATCGFPLVSAWASISAAVDALPCWTPTGASYPAFETIACT